LREVVDIRGGLSRCVTVSVFRFVMVPDRQSARWSTNT
jgi:hypothetical protein